MPQDRTFTLTRLSLVEGGAHKAAAYATSLTWKHVDGPVYLNIKHVPSRVRLELTKGEGSPSLLTGIINRTTPHIKLDMASARFKSAGVRAALSFPAHPYTLNGLVERFQCAFTSPAEATECGKLLSPFFHDVTGPALVSQAPAPALKSVQYSQSPAGELQSLAPPKGKKGGAKRKTVQESSGTPAKKAQKKEQGQARQLSSDGPGARGNVSGELSQASNGSAGRSASDSGGNDTSKGSDPSASALPSLAQPINSPLRENTVSGSTTANVTTADPTGMQAPAADGTQQPVSDIVSAMKADLLRNFGQTASPSNPKLGPDSTPHDISIASSGLGTVSYSRSACVPGAAGDSLDASRVDIHSAGTHPAPARPPTSHLPSAHTSSPLPRPIAQSSDRQPSTATPLDPAQAYTARADEAIPDLLPRSPLIDTSPHPDPPRLHLPSPHVNDLLALDPAGFVPTEELSLVNDSYPVMQTTYVERMEAIRISAEDAEFEDVPVGESSETQVSGHLGRRTARVMEVAQEWRSWDEMGDEVLYALLGSGGIPEAFLSLAHRVLHMYNHMVQLGEQEDTRARHQSSQSLQHSETPLHMSAARQSLQYLNDDPKQSGSPTRQHYSYSTQVKSSADQHSGPLHLRQREISPRTVPQYIHESGAESVEGSGSYRRRMHDQDDTAPEIAPTQVMQIQYPQDRYQAYPYFEQQAVHRDPYPLANSQYRPSSFDIADQGGSPFSDCKDIATQIAYAQAGYGDETRYRHAQYPAVEMAMADGGGLIDDMED